MSVLGYDCEGKPLYAGDRVIIVIARANPYLEGKTTTILGPAKHGGTDEVAIDIMPRLSVEVRADCSNLRKIANDDKSTWDETEKTTGWKPVRECA